jgi:hypothetical protein
MHRRGRFLQVIGWCDLKELVLLQMILILKIVLQGLTCLVALLIANLDYLWHDKRTLKFKKTRRYLYIALFLSFSVSIFVTYQDDQEKKREIAELTSKLDEITNELTGGDTYAYFMADPSTGAGDPPTYPLTLWVKGKHPMRNAVAQIQTVYDDPAKQLQSRRIIPLGDGTLSPGFYPMENNFRVPVGQHIITIESRRGRLNELLVLSMSNGDLQQTGDVFRDGKKLHTIGDPY